MVERGGEKCLLSPLRKGKEEKKEEEKYESETLSGGRGKKRKEKRKKKKVFSKKSDIQSKVDIDLVDIVTFREKKK